MKAAIVAALLFAFSPFVRAESCAVASLEWLADSSSSIGIYVADSIVDQSNSRCTLSLRLLKTLKQNPAATIRVDYLLQEYPSSPENIYPTSHPTTVAVGNRFLIFGEAEHGPINLTIAQPYDSNVAAVAAGGQVLTGAAAILHTVKKRPRTHPTTERVQKQNSYFVDVPNIVGMETKTFFDSFDSWSIIIPPDLRPKRLLFEPEGLTTNVEEKE